MGYNGLFFSWVFLSVAMSNYWLFVWWMKTDNKSANWNTEMIKLMCKSKCDVENRVNSLNSN